MSKLPSNPPTHGALTEKSYFEQQRDILMRDIGVGMEQVLQNINKFNRSLEGIIAVGAIHLEDIFRHGRSFTEAIRVQVGNEFSSVEALWSHFENIMAKDPQEDEERVHKEDGDAQ